MNGVETQASIAFLPTPDLERAARFYEDVIGLSLAVDQGSCRIYRITAGAYIGLVQREDAQPMDQFILCLVCDDVDRVHVRFLEHGVPVDGPPRENPRFRIYHFFAQDPDGHRLEVQRFLHPF